MAGLLRNGNRAPIGDWPREDKEINNIGTLIKRSKQSIHVADNCGISLQPGHWDAHNLNLLYDVIINLIVLPRVNSQVGSGLDSNAAWLSMPLVDSTQQTFPQIPTQSLATYIGTNMCHIHTVIVSRHLTTRSNNKILRTPLHISSSE